MTETDSCSKFKVDLQV